MKMQYYSGNKTPTQLMDLPIEMVVNILLRLPVESLRCIRRVSKTLLNTVDSRSFARQHTLSLIAVNNSHVVHRVPQLMCFAESIPLGGTESFPTLQSLRYDGSTTLTKGRFAFTHDSNSSYPIDFVFYNLFCMASYKDEKLLLINPLLREVLSLPTYKIQQLTVDNDITIGFYGMGFDNRTNTYKIVQVSISGIWRNQQSYKTHIHVLGTNSWREIPSVPPSWGITWGCNICAYGDMHWLLRRSPGGSGATESHLVSFDFKKEEFRWTPTPPILRSSNKDSNLHLLTLRGSMSIVETYPSPEGGGMKIEIWVMKDYLKKEWAREYNINIDMQPEIGLAYDTTCGEWEHGIFFNDQSIWKKSDGTFKLLVDLRTASVNLAIYPIDTEIFTNIMSYTGSLISLRDYGSIYYTDNRAS